LDGGEIKGEPGVNLGDRSPAGFELGIIEDAVEVDDDDAEEEPPCFRLESRFFAWKTPK
jgi:hypothetical protein